PWIERELRLVNPRVVVAMGAVAVRSLLGRPATISSLRDTVVPIGDALGVVTIHPSAILRTKDARDEMRAGLVRDLRRAGELAAQPETQGGR
ncbi:MAG TPA: uracil-DNA glycosylase family protein, partial [Ilumatobacteraceae bacterium]